jgi:hypothetical protein
LIIFSIYKISIIDMDLKDFNLIQHVTPDNECLRRQIEETICKTSYHSHESHDFDRSRFKITNEQSDPLTTKLGFTCFGAKQILENGGDAFLKEKYGDYYQGATLDGYEVVLSLSEDQKPKKQSVPDGASSEEKAKIKEENAQMKEALLDKAVKISHQW